MNDLTKTKSTDFRVEDKFSQRAINLSGSVIREILKVTERPDVISFAGGLPSPKGFPNTALLEAFTKVLTDSPEIALQYGPTEGYRPLREWIVQDFAKRGVQISVDEVLIVSGSQQALDLLGKLFIDDGAKILVESPSYLGALQSFSVQNPQYATVETDDQGMIPADITADKAKDARFIYALPNFQNPTGITMTLARRQELVDTCAKYGLPIIEDDPYGELRFEGEHLPSLLDLGRKAGATVIRMGSFSKILAPGLRLGFVVAPATVINKMVQLKQATDLHTQTISQMAVYEALKGDFLAQHLPTVRELYRKQCHFMLDALSEYFPDSCKWTRPTGGMFIWASVPEHIDTAAILPQVVEECKVAYVPGMPFYTDLNKAPKNNLRLSFVTVSEDKIKEGISSLGRFINNLS
ncbi:PLP-dependent aminotransferase family protein [Oligella ureolytica]|nr:PLP-dependent aminotransferase family protein [Alcaligenaceae bacterium]HZJ96416.1 PLP-dependent aminotransferase family protein [Oligella sp.]